MHITYFIIGKKKYDTNNQCTTLFSGLCTVSDETFGRLSIERCWDIWLKECKGELSRNDFSDNKEKKEDKIKYQYAVKIKTKDLVAGQVMI